MLFDNTEVLAIVPRVVNAYKPNPNTNIIYYRLEEALQKYMQGSNGCTFIQLEPDPPDCSIADSMTIKVQHMCGRVEEIRDDSILCALYRDMYETRIKNHLDTYRIGFYYTVENVEDPMTEVKIIKPVLYLKPLMRKNKEDKDNDSNRVSGNREVVAGQNVEGLSGS